MDHMRLLDSCSHHWLHLGWSFIGVGRADEPKPHKEMVSGSLILWEFIFLLQHTSGQMREKVGSSKNRFPKSFFSWDVEVIEWVRPWGTRLAFSPMILGGVAGCRDWLLSCVSQKYGRFGQRKEGPWPCIHGTKLEKELSFPSGWERKMRHSFSLN